MSLLRRARPRYPTEHLGGASRPLRADLIQGCIRHDILVPIRVGRGLISRVSAVSRGGTLEGIYDMAVERGYSDQTRTKVELRFPVAGLLFELSTKL